VKDASLSPNKMPRVGVILPPAGSHMPWQRGRQGNTWRCAAHKHGAFRPRQCIRRPTDARVSAAPAEVAVSCGAAVAGTASLGSEGASFSGWKLLAANVR
jgi:hypothetical protein